MVPFGNRRGSFLRPNRPVLSLGRTTSLILPLEVVLPPVTAITSLLRQQLMLNGRSCPKFGSKLSVACWAANWWKETCSAMR